VDGHPRLRVEEDLIVPLRPSPCITEVLRQALSVCTNGADHSELELLRQELDLVDVAVPSVLGPISAFHFVALVHIPLQGLDRSHCRPLDIVCGGLSCRLAHTNMHTVGVGQLRVIEGSVQNTEFPGLPYIDIYMFIMVETKI